MPRRRMSQDRGGEDDRRNGDRRVIAWAPLPAERRKVVRRVQGERRTGPDRRALVERRLRRADRKSTRLNSSHQIISYALFCFKKKKKTKEKQFENIT